MRVLFFLSTTSSAAAADDDNDDSDDGSSRQTHITQNEWCGCAVVVNAHELHTSSEMLTFLTTLSESAFEYAIKWHVRERPRQERAALWPFPSLPPQNPIQYLLNPPNL